MTPDQIRRHAAAIILDHARDVEFLSIGEHLGDHDIDDPDDKTAQAIDEAIAEATVTVEWPEPESAGAAFAARLDDQYAEPVETPDDRDPVSAPHPPQFAEINAIVKRRYETGEYGSAHFRFPAALFAEARSAVPPATPKPLPLLTNPLGDLLGIPIVVDETLPATTWRLVDTLTGEVIHEGGA